MEIDSLYANAITRILYEKSHVNSWLTEISQTFQLAPTSLLLVYAWMNMLLSITPQAHYNFHNQKITQTTNCVQLIICKRTYSTSNMLKRIEITYYKYKIGVAVQRLCDIISESWDYISVENFWQAQAHSYNRLGLDQRREPHTTQTRPVLEFCHPVLKAIIWWSLVSCYNSSIV